MDKKRLDLVMEERGIAHSRSLAQRIIMAGAVRVNGVVALRPAVKVSETDKIEVTESPRFVSRGGEKLLEGLVSFSLTNLEHMVCVDVGASTGGFTDCMLQHGAKKVYAVDVGYGVLDWNIRNDPRVMVMERTNARYITEFDEVIHFVTIDASFISLRVLLPVVRGWFKGASGQVVALIKPQFEAGRADTARGSGVIRDPLIHQTVLQGVLDYAQAEGFQVNGLIKSPLTGPKGNIEFLVHLVLPKNEDAKINAMISKLFPVEEPDASIPGQKTS